MRFPRLRLIILGLALAAQVYLFLRIRRAVLASGRSARFKARVIRLIGGGMIVLFLLNAYLLVAHLPWVDLPGALQFGLFYPVAIWGFGSLFSALTLALTRFGGAAGRAALRRLRRRTLTAPAAVDRARRRLLQAGVGAVAAAPVLLSGYGAAYAGRTYTVERLSLPFGRSLTVVQLTDIHAGLYMTRDDLRHYAARVSALQPDLFLLTGDYITNSMAYLPACVEEMARVQARYGTFATLGNHEHLWGDVPATLTAFARAGIPVLHNTHTVLQTPQGPLALAGIDDLQWGAPDLEGALRGLDSAIPTLLLSHRPEIFPMAAARGIRLTLAGHYHGGQIALRVPGGRLSLAHLRTPYPEGLFHRDGAHLYVSRGIGTTFTPVRLNAPPEITVIRLA